MCGHTPVLLVVLVVIISNIILHDIDIIIHDIVEISMLIKLFTSSDHLFMCSILLLCKNDNYDRA